MLKVISLAFVLTFLGKILAFFRVQQLASNYGQEYWLDAFFIVFSFTSLFDTILITGALATTFIPHYLKERSISISKSEYLYSNVFSSMLSIFALFSLIIFVFSYEISSMLVKGDNESLILAVDFLLKNFSLFPLLSLLFQLPTIYNQANSNYQISTLNPIFLNGIQLLLISAVSYYGSIVERDVQIFLLGYLITMFLCFIIQVVYFKPAMPRNIFSIDLQILKLFSLAVLPFIVFISIEEFNLLVDQYFATSLKEGSVSNLLYANRLVKIFGAIFVASIITVYYPKVSSLIAKGKQLKVRYVSSLIIELLAVLTIPIVAIFYFFSLDIVQLLYGENISPEVGDVLGYYSFLVFTSSIYLIQIRLVYSIGISKLILLLCVGISIANFILNTLLIDILGLAGLALSTVLVSIFQVVLFDVYLKSKGLAVFSLKMIFRLIVHLIQLITIMLLISRLFPSLLNELWILGAIAIFLIYLIVSVVFNKKLFQRIIKL